MLRELFAARSSRSLESNRCRRLELEPLEDRVPPAAMVAGLPPGPYASGGSFAFGPGSSIVQAPGATTSYPSLYLTPFGYSPESYALASLGAGLPVGLNPYAATSQNVAEVSYGNGGGGGGGGGGAGQLLGQMERLIGTLASVAAMQNNPQQVLSLAIDEFFRAADTFAIARGQAVGASTSSIQTFLTDHQNAIDQNPVDHTAIGQMLGTAVYDATLLLLASGQGGT